MPSDFFAFLKALAESLSKFPLKKLDKYQTLNGIFDVLATIGFALVCFLSPTKGSIMIAFLGWLGFMSWCFWMCFQFGKK
jgi:hypothetical protein